MNEVNNQLENEIVQNEIVQNEIVQNEIVQNEIVQNEIIPKLTTTEYSKNKEQLNKIKLSDLRGILRYYKKKMHAYIIQRFANKHTKNIYKKICNKIHDFTLLGNKAVLRERVKLFFNQDNMVRIIQKHIRGIFIRLANKLRGPAYKNHNICINTTDFCTLEPLNEINNQTFFSYSSSVNNTVYGFDINSLITLIKKKGKLENPYTRENMNHYIRNINKLHRLNMIHSLSKNNNNNQYKNELQTFNLYNNTIESQTIQRRLNSIVLPGNYNVNEITQKMHNIRNEPILTRIQNLFMEIDNLGNYTQSSWFLDLSRVECIRYYRILKDIWNFRCRIPFHIKIKICPLWDPFHEAHNYYYNMNIEQIQKLCINVMEAFVFMGIDNDSKILGSFQILTALTVVSERARIAMPWLYESLF